MENDIHIISKEEYSSHPLFARLLELHKVPEKIYFRGTIPNITVDDYGRLSPRILTIVGSRKYTQYGKQCLERLCRELRGENIIILSGLAYGIDIISHKEAIKNNLLTIALPGSGLNDRVIYPQAHVSFAKEIIAHHGLLLSELDPNTRPSKWVFPSRNRILACLSDAVLVIEAGEKSGTLITARQALELGRDIGAIPGEIFSSTSKGTNMLIHEGAYAITCGDDVLDLLHLSKKATSELEIQSYDECTPNEHIILKLLSQTKEKDSLLIESNLSLESFLSAFSSLEIKGYIEETFGEVRRLV